MFNEQHIVLKNGQIPGKCQQRINKGFRINIRNDGLKGIKHLRVIESYFLMIISTILKKTFVMNIHVQNNIRVHRA